MLLSDPLLQLLVPHQMWQQMLFPHHQCLHCIKWIVANPWTAKYTKFISHKSAVYLVGCTYEALLTYFWQNNNISGRPAIYVHVSAMENYTSIHDRRRVSHQLTCRWLMLRLCMVKLSKCVHHAKIQQANIEYLIFVFFGSL